MTKLSIYINNFPINKRAGTAYDQLKHAAGEIVEAAAENDPLRQAVEVLDAIECLEGALRAIESDYPKTIKLAYKSHFDKNNERGDYDGQLSD